MYMIFFYKLHSQNKGKSFVHDFFLYVTNARTRSVHSLRGLHFFVVVVSGIAGKSLTENGAILRQRGTKFSVLSPILSGFDQFFLKCSS